MGSWRSLTFILNLLASSVYADVNHTKLSSHQILPSTFKPPPVFKNVHLMRHTNLEKGYVRDTINVVIQNLAKEQQHQYYLPFDANTISKVGGLEVRDKKDPDQPAFLTELVEYDPYRYVAYRNCARCEK